MRLGARKKSTLANNLKMRKITVIGIGPGNSGDLTGRAVSALSGCTVLVGYKYYIPFIEKYLNDEAEVLASGMKQERQRISMALDRLSEGSDVCVISSGDSGIYGMASLVCEMMKERGIEAEVEVIPGISAFQKAASLLGAPVGHDFCVISLSDLMTPWALIEKRIKAAAEADFITAVYNPRSNSRYWQLFRFKEIFLTCRSGDTPVGFVRQAGRDGEQVTVTTLSEFNPEDVDMFTVVIIGNSQTYCWDGKMITPRGYYRDKVNEDETAPGQNIMIKSFRTIEKEMKHPEVSLNIKWPMLHAIHTTADFDMENIVKVDDNAMSKIYSAFETGRVRTIITDVTMAASGIRKGALARLGIEVKCYLNESGVMEYAKEKGITRTQSGIRMAVKDHPDALYVFGNAPTALMELCELIRRGVAHPCGIVAAPVGFVHVCESKQMVKPFVNIPKIIVEGRKGGSNLAATVVNSILCWPDASQLKPGRDV